MVGKRGVPLHLCLARGRIALTLMVNGNNVPYHWDSVGKEILIMYVSEGNNTLKLVVMGQNIILDS